MKIHDLLLETASPRLYRAEVYVDMDGVLADFFGEVAREHDVKYWREIHRKDLGIDQIAQEPGFFKLLPVLPNAGKLMQGVISLASKYSILSSPLMSNVEESSKEKMQWLQRHLKNHQPQAVIFDHEKYKYAQQPDETPNILIDDWDTNIRLWEANGGIGILYKPEEVDKALHKLHLALLGKIKPKKIDVLKNEVDRYGILEIASQSDLKVRAKAVIEKPNADNAPSSTAIIGRYILRTSIFEPLGFIENKLLIELTPPVPLMSHPK